MPITPATLAKRRATCSFECEGETVHLDYYPAAIGPNTVNELRAWMDRANASDATDEAAQTAMLNEFGTWVCTILAGWDYLEDDGETPQALTPENIGAQLIRFPDFMLAVLMAILQDRAQGNASGTPPSPASGVISLRKAR